MANAVAVLMVETELPIMMTCADEAIPKGTVLQLSGALTVSATSSNEDVFGGIAAEEKISGDGKLQIAVYRHGIFKCEVGTGNVTLGTPCGIIAANEFTTTTDGDDLKGANFGISLEAANDGEFFLLDLGRAN